MIETRPGTFDTGVEYIVSERLFLALPDEEKKLWHSHFYEVEEVLIFLGFSTY
jgi:hypothetical protein